MISFGRSTLINVNTLTALLVSLTLTACGGGGGGGGGNDFSPTSTNNTKPQSSVEASSLSSSSSSVVGEIPGTSTSSSSSLSSSSKSSTSSPRSSSSSRSSSAGSLIDVTAPSTPGEITPTAIYNRVALTWEPATDNVAVVYYRIYRDQVLIDTLWAPEDSFIDFDVAPNRTYVYGISAGDGVKNWSPVKSVTITTPSAPTQSVSSTSRASSTSSASSTPASGNSSSRSSSNSSSSRSNSSSSRSSSVAPDLTAPSLPDAKLDSAFASHVDISWPAATDNTAVTAYKVYRDGTLISTLGADVLNYSDTSVQASHQYIYGVSAGDAAGNWSAQKTLFATTPAVANSGNITLVWLTPLKRENGVSFSLAELSGFELRYKRQTDTDYTYVSLSKLTLLYIIPNITGDYEFALAAIDNNNLYSEFKSLTPQ